MADGMMVQGWTPLASALRQALVVDNRNRAHWANELRAGHHVAVLVVRTTFRQDLNVHARMPARNTADPDIVLSDGSRYDCTGTLNRDRPGDWESRLILRPSPETQEQYEHRRLRNEIVNLPLTRLSSGQLAAILKIAREQVDRASVEVPPQP